MKTFLEFYNNQTTAFIKKYDPKVTVGDPRYDNVQSVQTKVATPPPSDKVTTIEPKIIAKDLPPLPRDSGSMNAKTGDKTYPERKTANYVPEPIQKQQPMKQRQKPDNDSESGSVKTDPAGRKYVISKDNKRTKFLTGKQGSPGTKAGTTPFSRKLISNKGSDRESRR